MKNSSASFFALSLYLLFLAPSSACAQVCSAGIGATLPRGFPDCGSSPARIAEGLGVRASWEEPSGCVALRNYALSAEWGNARYRAGALFSWASLDSVYRNAGGSAEFAVTFLGRFTLGAGHGLSVSYVPGVSSWSRQTTRLGALALLGGGFSASAIGSRIYGEGDAFSFGAHWEIPESYLLYSEAAFRDGRKFLHVGFGARFGAVSVRNAYLFPGPGVAVSFSVGADLFAAGAGYYRTPGGVAFKNAEFLFKRHR